MKVELSLGPRETMYLYKALKLDRKYGYAPTLIEMRALIHKALIRQRKLKRALKDS